MNPFALIEQASAFGVELELCPDGDIKAIGDPREVNLFLPVLRVHKKELGVILAMSELTASLVICNVQMQIAMGN